MAKRGENIRKRKDGRWEARIVNGVDFNGKNIYHSIYGKTYQEVKEKRNDWIAGLSSEKRVQKQKNHLTEKTTRPYGEIIDEWLFHKKDSIKSSSYSQYNSMIEEYIKKDLGDNEYVDLTAEKINIFLHRLLNDGRQKGLGGLSSKTVTDIRAIIIQTIEYAEEHGYYGPSSKDIFYPKKYQKPIAVLTKHEQKRLVDHLYDELSPLNIGIIIALFCGLRIGELCALKWRDFSSQTGTIHINKTLLRIPNVDENSASRTKIIISPPKTASSNRIIPLPSFLTDLLKRKRGCENDYVLTGNIKYMEPRVCLAKYKKVLRSAGLSDYTFHALRHTFATRCIENGFDVKSLSEILGHANVSTTMQRYVHPSLDSKKEQMNRLSNLAPCIRGQIS